MTHTLWIKLIKHFYSIKGPLDEYRLAEANRMGNHCFILSYWWQFLSLLIAYGLYLSVGIGPAFWLLFLGNLLVYFTLLPFYLFWEIRRTAIIQKETNKKPDKKMLPVLAHLMGSGLFAIFMAWPSKENPDFLANFLHWKTLVQLLIFSIITTGGLYMFNSKLAQTDTQEED